MKRLLLTTRVCRICVSLILSSLPAGAAAGNEGLSGGDPLHPPAIALSSETVLALADEDPEAARKNKPPAQKPDPMQSAKRKPAAGPLKFPKEITPTPAQEAKLEALLKKFGPQLEAMAQSEQEVYTPEQREAMKAAREDSRAAGKRGKEANDLVAASVRLTRRQQEELESIHQERKALDERVKAAVLELLTPQQRELMAKKGPGKPKGPPQKKPENR